MNNFNWRVFNKFLIDQNKETTTMGLLKVNKDDLSRGKLFTPGKWYKVKITSYKEEQTRGQNPSTNHIWNLVCLPTGDPELDVFIGASPGVLFNEKGFDIRFDMFMQACKVNKDADGGYSVEPRSLVGKEIEVFVEHRPDKNDKNKLYNNCAQFRALSGE